VPFPLDGATVAERPRGSETSERGPRREQEGEEERRRRTGKRKRLYLVLRARRACNHRGTAKRPSTPSHSAFSPFYFSRPSSPARTSVHRRGTTFLRPVRPLTLSRTSLSLSLSSPPSSPAFLLHLGAPRRVMPRCAHSIIIIGFRSRAACVAAPLPFRFPSFLPFPLSPFVCTRCSPLSASTTSSVTNWNQRVGATTKRTGVFPPSSRNVSSRCACWPISEPASARSRAFHRPRLSLPAESMALVGQVSRGK